jgi:hypothetical protein
MESALLATRCIFRTRHRPTPRTPFRLTPRLTQSKLRPMHKRKRFRLPRLLLGIFLVYPGATRAETSVEGAVVTILRDGVPELGIEPNPSHPLLGSPRALKEIVEAIETAGDAYPRVGPLPLTALCFLESAFIQSTRSKAGAQSAFQMLPLIAGYTRAFEPRCRLDTLKGSAFCAAAWLDRWIGKCGSALDGHIMYLSGSCRPRSRLILKTAQKRLHLAEYLKSAPP